MGLVDKKSLLLMSFLRNNARENLTMLSRKTNIPVSTIYDRLKGFTGSLIVKHTSLLDFGKLGFNARANMMVKVSRDEQQGLKDFLLSHQNVNSVYRISNGYDYLAEGVFRNVRDVEEFLESLGKRFIVEKQEVYYVVEDLKKECFLADKDFVELVI